MPRNYRRPLELVAPKASAMVLFASPGRGSDRGLQADVAQLVERNLAKVEVASSSLVVRSERVSSPSSGGLAERRGNGLQIRVHGFKSRTHLDVPPSRAIGAVVARFPDTEEVTGSNPVSPTSSTRAPRNVSPGGRKAARGDVFPGGGTRGSSRELRHAGRGRRPRKIEDLTFGRAASIEMRTLLHSGPSGAGARFI
jgi:hypothetical protein